MKTKLITLITGTLVFLLITATSLVAQTDRTVEKILSLAKEDNQTMDHLNILVNRIGARFVGSAGIEAAEQWATDMFEKWGLEVEIIEVGRLHVGFDRGPSFGRMLCHQDGMVLHFGTPGFTAGTKGRQRGQVLMEPKSQQEFDRMKGALNGAWVLISGSEAGAIDYSSRGDSLRNIVIQKNNEISRRNSENARWNRENPNARQREMEELEEMPALFYKQMREAGILGIIQSASVPLSIGYDRRNFRTMTWDNLPTVPDIKLNEHQYRIIEQKVKERQYFVLEFDIRNNFRPGPKKYHNIMAKIRGYQYPDEYIITGGHLDSYDIATGGVDCGTGVAPAMEAARLIMKAMAETGARPKRTIVFSLWAAEEIGLEGSKHWVENNKDKWPNIINYFNRDGGPTVANSMAVPRDWMEDMKRIAAPLNTFNPEFPFTVTEAQPRPRPTAPRGSDHAYFMINGIPAISFGTADVKGYNFSYPEIWHTERDTYDKSIPEYMEHTSVVNAVILWGMANLDRRLPAKGVYSN
jgi:hypothetical protein